MTKKVNSYSLDHTVIFGLKKKAIELSEKLGRHVTASSVLEHAAKTYLEGKPSVVKPSSKAPKNKAENH